MSTAATTPPGWKAVVSNKTAFDIPASWPVKPNKSPDGVPLQVGVYREGYCPSSPTSVRAQVYAFDSYDSADPVKATQIYTTGQARNATRNPKITGGQPEPGPDGTVHARSTITPSGNNPCDPPAIALHVVAKPNGHGGSHMLLITADQQVPDAVSKTEIETIARSIRKAE